MNALLKSPAFWVGLLGFLFLTILALLSNKKRSVWLICILVATGLYTSQYYLNYKENIKEIKEKLIQSKLSSIERFKHFDPSQTLRSNIFLSKQKNGKTIYYVACFYNMDAYEDKQIEILENMGCTGEAWSTKRQVWGDKKRIFQEGKYRVPDDQLKKVWRDLEWICSTPIIKDGNVIAVLNFDGNKRLTRIQQEQISDYCKKLIDELKTLI